MHRPSLRCGAYASRCSATAQAGTRVPLSLSDLSVSLVLPTQKRRMADKALTEDNGFLGHKKVSYGHHMFWCE